MAQAGGARARAQGAALVLLALALSATCLIAARWQWGRHVQVSAKMRQIERNYDAPPIGLDQAFAALAAGFDPARSWQPVTATGRYLTERTVLLRGRAISGEATYQVLLPLKVSGGALDGALWLIDRGYLKASPDGSAPAIPPAPGGQVTVTARLQPFERANARTPPPGQVFSITPAAAGAGQVIAAYGIASAEDPAPSSVPLALPRPAIDYGNHLSYTMQWLIFALAAPLAVFLLYRRDRRAKAGQARPPRRTGRAEQEEDAEVERLLALRPDT